MENLTALNDTPPTPNPTHALYRHNLLQRARMLRQGPRIETIRKSLIGDLADFVAESGFDRQPELHVVADFVHQLSDYREESISFFPSIYLVRAQADFHPLSMIAPGAERIMLRTVSLSDDAAATILKDSAALATRGWSILVELDSATTTAKYGIFRSEQLPFSLSSAELLADRDTPTGTALLIRNCSRNSVELISGNGAFLEFTLSSAKPTGISMASNICTLTEMASLSVPETIRTSFHSYYNRALSTIFQHCHGTIVGVLASNLLSVPLEYSDGVILETPVSIADAFRSLQESPTAVGLAHLSALEALLRGMIHCDGITLLANDGTIRAFRVFIKPSQEEQSQLQNFGPKGGARSRAYQLMKHRLGDTLKCAFFRSQDGKMECQVAQ